MSMVQPTETRSDPAHHRRERAAEGLRKVHAGQNELRRDADGYVEYRPELLYLLSLGPRCLSSLL